MTTDREREIDEVVLEVAPYLASVKRTGSQEGYLFNLRIEAWLVRKVRRRWRETHTLILRGYIPWISDARLAEIAAIPDDEIDLSDIPEATAEDFARMVRKPPLLVVRGAPRR